MRGGVHATDKTRYRHAEVQEFHDMRLLAPYKSAGNAERFRGRSEGPAARAIARDDSAVNGAQQGRRRQHCNPRRLRLHLRLTHLKDE